MTAAVAGFAVFRVDSRASRGAPTSSVPRPPQDRDEALDVVRVSGPSSVTPADTSEELGARHIGDGTKGTSHRETLPLFDILLVKICAVQHQYLRGFCPSSKSGRNGHVEFGRVHIREFMDAECRLMGINAFRFTRPIAGPESIDDQLLLSRLREARQPVDAPFDAHPIS